MSARHLINNLPGVARRYQRFRYRNWIRKIDPHWVSSAPRPHFIIIGAPKCGTSWLLAVLKQHPNVRMAPKEIEYFSFHLEYPFEWYLEHFARLTASLEPPGSTPLVLGEKSARYCSIPQAQIRRVRELLPDVRLVLMARDPIDRHWAHAKRHFGKRQFHKPEMAVLDVPRSKLFSFFDEMRPLSEFSKIIANWTTGLSVVATPRRIAGGDAALAARDIRRSGRVYRCARPITIQPQSPISRQSNRGPRVEMPTDVAEFLEDMLLTERKWLHDLFGNRAFLHVS